MGVSMSVKKSKTVSAVQEAAQYLTFLLDGEMFAINILHIKEIIEYGQLTAVPLMPDYIRGVINLRGAVVPVVDLAARFSGQSTELTRRTCVVIVEVETDEGNRDIGVMVDAVSAVLDMPDSEIEPAPSFGAHIRADFIKGMGKVNGKFVIILNVNNVLLAGGVTVPELDVAEITAVCEE